MLRRHVLQAGTLLLLMSLGACERSAETPAPQPQTVRCAVIGGMVDTELFVKVGERFHADTGDSVEIVATGPKGTVAAAVRDGKADLVTMHSSDTIVNLVADGYALDPQPWVRNELVIVGPADDPAGIRGLSDAVEAFRRIAERRTPFVMHSSIGSQEVLRDVLQNTKVQLDPEQLVYSPEERKQMVLRLAEEKHGYTLVGRIPFLDGKMPSSKLAMMVQGDERLRRPYLVAAVNPRRVPSARLEAAKRLAAYLRSPKTQQWLLHYGEGKLDSRPLFFPVDVGLAGH